MHRFLFLFISIFVSGAIPGYSQESYDNLESLELKNGLSHGFVYDILQLNTTELIVANSKGIFSFDGKNWTKIKIDFKNEDFPTHLHFNKRNSQLYAGTFNGYLYRLGARPLLIDSIDNPLKEIVSLNGTPVLIDQLGNIKLDGTLYNTPVEGEILLSAASHDKSIELSYSTLTLIFNTSTHSYDSLKGTYFHGDFNLSTKSSRHRIDKDLLKLDETIEIRSISSWNEIAWVATDNGVYKYQFDTASMSNFILTDHLSESNGLMTNDIMSVYHDADGTLWIGSNGEGLTKLPSTYSISLKFKEEIIQTSVINNSDLLILTTKGLLKVRKENGEHILDTAIVLNKKFNCILPFNDGYLMGAHNGLYFTIDGSLIRPISLEPELPSDLSINNIQLIDEQIWISTEVYGLIILDQELTTIKTYDTSNGLSHNDIKNVIVSGNNRILITGGYGITTITKDGMVAHSPNKLLDRLLISSKVDIQETIPAYGTSNNGLVLILGDSLLYANRYVPELPSHVFDMVRKDGQLWILGLRKVSVLTGDLETQYTHSFPTNNNTHGSIHVLSNNEVVSTNSHHIHRYFWSRQNNTKAHNIEVKQIISNDKSIPIANSIDLGSGNKNLSVYIEKTCINNYEDLIVEYRLIGLSNSWSPLTNEKISFNNLQPGEYSLEIRTSFTNQHGNNIHQYTQKYLINIDLPFYKSLWFIISASVLAALMIWFIAHIRHRNSKKEAIKLAGIVRDRTNEIRQQNLILASKNKDISDSINYAKRIQETILPADSKEWNYFKQHHIIYHPKDIVSGDFYWLECVNNIIYVAAADCTGHGVPGAMVSVICSNALRYCLYDLGLREPNEILQKSSEIIADRFKVSGNQIQDGMDIALCKIDGKNLTFCGAHNPLWILRGNEIIQLDANKQPVGYYEYSKEFVQFEHSLLKGDRLYMFSDGYADQFGRLKKDDMPSKFKKRNFYNLIKDSHELDLKEQCELLEKTLQSWSKFDDQIDDITVITVEI